MAGNTDNLESLTLSLLPLWPLLRTLRLHWPRGHLVQALQGRQGAEQSCALSWGSLSPSLRGVLHHNHTAHFVETQNPPDAKDAFSEVEFLEPQEAPGGLWVGQGGHTWAPPPQEPESGRGSPVGLAGGRGVCSKGY